jgi:hypothetical protein
VKSLTREQARSRKDKAVRFVRDVLDDPERADEIEDEDLEDYAERRKIQLTNQRRNAVMAKGGNGGYDPRTKQDLLDEVDDLQHENQDLQDQLDAIQDILTPADEEEDDDGDGDDDDDDDQPAKLADLS